MQGYIYIYIFKDMFMLVVCKQNVSVVFSSSDFCGGFDNLHSIRVHCITFLRGKKCSEHNLKCSATEAQLAYSAFFFKWLCGFIVLLVILKCLWTRASPWKAVRREYWIIFLIIVPLPQ